LHGIAIGKDSIFGLNPIDDVNKLLGEKISKTHWSISFPGRRLNSAQLFERDATGCLGRCQQRRFAVRAVDIADRKEIFFPEFACRPGNAGSGNDALAADRFVTEK
jgi:hypothetical protein